MAENIRAENRDKNLDKKLEMLFREERVIFYIIQNSHRMATATVRLPVYKSEIAKLAAGSAECLLRGEDGNVTIQRRNDFVGSVEIQNGNEKPYSIVFSEPGIYIHELLT